MKLSDFFDKEDSIEALTIYIMLTIFVIIITVVWAVLSKFSGESFILLACWGLIHALVIIIAVIVKFSKYLVNKYYNADEE